MNFKKITFTETKPYIATTGFECSCNAGYALSGATDCVNVNECLADPCLSGQDCFDTIGSFTCQCPPGTTVQESGSCIGNLNETRFFFSWRQLLFTKLQNYRPMQW